MFCKVAALFHEVQASCRHKVARKHIFICCDFSEIKPYVGCQYIAKSRWQSYFFSLPDVDISDPWPHTKVSFEILKTEQFFRKSKNVGDKVASESAKMKDNHTRMPNMTHKRWY